MHHSTHLKTLEEHCDLAYITPVTNREPFHVGTAAHAVMEEITRGPSITWADVDRIAQTTAARLIKHGRSFDGEKEPPLPPNQVFEGRDIAVAYVKGHGVVRGEAELGLAVDGLGIAVNYTSQNAYYGAVHDLVEIGDDAFGDAVLTVCMSTDYKTAWPTNESELDTLQRRGQAVTLFAHYAGQVEVIRQRVVNLRTGGEWSRDIMLDEDGIGMIHKWWKDIRTLCNKADAVKDSPETVVPRPGVNCLGCHHAPKCPHVYEMAKLDSPQGYAAAKQAHAVLAKKLRAELKDRPPIDAGDGFVGYRKKERAVLTDDAVDILVDEWLKTGEPTAADVRAILTAADIGVTQARNIAKVLFPGREGVDDRRAFLDAITNTETYAEFSAWK